MADRIKKVAVFGASGNFGTPITAALVKAGFEVTIVTQPSSKSIFPNGIQVIRSEYTVAHLTAALAGQDAAISVVGPAAITSNVAMVEAAAEAGVKRFIVNDFGWGPDFASEPEFAAIGDTRHVAWDRAKQLAIENTGFTWTGITIGNPIDWALKRFPLMGFDVKDYTATIYDEGTEQFTGTTLSGIGQSVVGVLKRPDATANRFVKARSIQTCQNELLAAFQIVTGRRWEVHVGKVSDLRESGKQKHQDGAGGWVLDLLVFQLFEPGKGRCIVASHEDSDATLLGIPEETAEDIALKAL
ncbi:uncharacterized protein JN550_002549 [Neoarthrinium moseri]|uniref:uncharacterized protein n=1 Tax=Neoarthrinium moseri TaxID=1658444 RepID=UPI001FDDBEE0|nr:uncharacterized protein JN550_002549 [Neoarthrinium moseri]KAI1875120.1 hypothetical protein JN550_002549 [Neoarthrinium moseri]